MRDLEETIAQLSQVSRLMDEATKEVEDYDSLYVQWKVQHLKEHTKAFLQASGAMDMRKATADLAAMESLEHREHADVGLRAAKERLRTLRDQMEILRTTAAAQRVQFMAEPTGQWS